jgi:hypothetical protein
MAKQRRSVVPAVALHLAKPHCQAKSRATPRALLQAPAPLGAKSQVTPRGKLPANSRTKVMLLVQQPAKS